MFLKSLISWPLLVHHLDQLQLVFPSNPKLLPARLDVYNEGPKHDVRERDENVIILVHYCVTSA